MAICVALAFCHHQEDKLVPLLCQTVAEELVCSVNRSLELANTRRFGPF